MPRTIYLDILFCMNFIIDYMILLSVKKFLSLSCRLRRLLLGAAAGGICSFVILLPPLPSGLSLILSLACACFVVGAAFAPLSKIMFFKAAAGFFLVSFGFCGIMMAALSLFSPGSLVIRNGIVYIGLSPIMLVVSSLFCYVIMRVIMRITGSGRPKDIGCTVRIRLCGRSIAFSGRLDTGSSLKEPFSGLPVIVAKRSLFSSLSEMTEQTDKAGNGYTWQEKGMRVIPYSSVGGEGMLYAFHPEGIIIINSGVKRKADAYIALCEDSRISGGEDSVVPFELIT